MKADKNSFIYLDHAALTPPLPELSEARKRHPRAGELNPHAGNRFSEELLRAIKNGERELLERLGSSEFEAEVIWTSGGTEANNLAVLGTLRTASAPLSLIESTAHKALLEPAQGHAAAGGGRCIEVPAGRNGHLQWSRIDSAAAGKAYLAGVCQVNNETGAVQDLKQLRTWLDQAAPDALLMVDALQSFAKIEIPWQPAAIDLLSIGGRKIGGPPQVGALIIRRGTPLRPLLYGGGQQKGLRPGTLDAAGILGFLEAARLVDGEKNAHWQHVQELNDQLRQRLKNSWEGPEPVFISPSDASPYILSLAFPGYEGAILVRALARKNIIAGSGSACSSESEGASHVLQAMGFDEKTARGLLRVSFSHQTTIKAVDAFLDALQQVIKEY